MLLNYDSLSTYVFVATAIIVTGLFTYSFYNIITTVHSTSNTIVYKEVGVQTESLVNTLPNLDSINELPESTYSVLQPTILHKIDTGVQTQTNSLWSMFKEWMFELFSMNSSDIGRTPTVVRVENWMENLESSQVLSSPTMNNVVSENIQNMVNTYDITDYSVYQNTLSQPNALFSHIVEDGIHK